MKKTLKRILCVLIVTVMAISPTSAFAFQSDGTEYVYGGELTEGMNCFFENTTWEERYDEIDFYCTFTAEFDGYYGFGFGHMHCYIEGDVYADDGTGTKQEYEHQYYGKYQCNYDSNYQFPDFDCSKSGIEIFHVAVHISALNSVNGYVFVKIIIS